MTWASRLSVEEAAYESFQWRLGTGLEVLTDHPSGSY